jgi:serine/threonine-protein kinase
MLAYARPKSERYWRTAALILGAVVLTGAGRAAWSRFAGPLPKPVYLELSVPDNRPLVIGSYGPFAISPDGETLVYAGVADGKQMLLARRLDRLTVDPLLGSDNGAMPFFSPDGKWVGFFAGGRLKKVQLDGGTAVVLAPATNARGGTWLKNGKIVFSPSSAGGLLMVSEEGGGRLDTLTVVDSAQLTLGVTNHRWPAALPDGSGVAFVTFNGSLADSKIGIVTLDRKVKITAASGTQPEFTHRGHLLWVNGEGALVVAPFSSRKLDITASPSTVAADVAVDGTAQAAFFTVSDDETLVYMEGSLIKPIVRVDRDGALTALKTAAE